MRLAIENRAFIGGEFKNLDGELIKKTSPINSVALSDLICTTAQDVSYSVECAFSAYNSGEWPLLPISDKKRVMFSWAQLLKENLENLAYLDTIETGRAYQNFIQDSIPKAINALIWFAEAADKLTDGLINESSYQLAMVTREPLGVVGIILPWNDPLVVAMWKIVPALLMGNTVVVKPAEQSTYSLLRVAELAFQAGLPKGVLNVVPGYGEITGKAIVEHQSVDGIFFTGSSAIGREILSNSSKSNLKRVRLECGGKGAFILTGNFSDLNLAAKILAKNIFYNQGQICSAPSRLIIHHAIKEKFLQIFSYEMMKYTPADPFGENTLVGAMISADHYARVKEYIDYADESGFRKIVNSNFSPPFENGFYIPPTVYVDIPIESKLAREEIFGPVLVVHSYTGLDEAIEIANSTEYGLAAAIWTEKVDEAFYAAKKLKFGMIHINSYGDDSIRVPFGGIKNSGIGVDKSLYAFDEYSNIKSTILKIGN